MIGLQPVASCIAVLVTALVNAVWQPAVIAAITGFALKISRCTNATTRHAVWTIALFASVFVPVMSAMTVVLPHAAVQTSATNSARAPALSKRAIAEKIFEAPFTPATLPEVHRPKIMMLPSVAQFVAIVWGILAVLILGRLALSFFYLERLKRDALPLSIDRRHALSRYERADKGQRDVRVCVSEEIRVPVAIGIFDAMILLPHDLVEELDATDLDRVLLHELAHVRRCDDWLNLFERIAVALLFFSPGVYYIARQMDLEREVACDDWVLSQAAENASYARCLARIVEMTQWPYRALAAPGVFVTRKSMSIRIERLLARGRDVRIRLALVPSFISVLAIITIVFAGGFISPTIAYTMAEPIAIRPMKIKPIVVAAKPKASPTAKPTATATPTATPLIALATPEATPEKTAAPVRTALPSPAPRRTSIPFHVSGGYLDELQAAGLTNLDPDDVVSLRSVGVTGEYIQQMRVAGLQDLSARELVTLKSVGVTPEYIAGMRRSGLEIPDARSAVELKSVGVTPEYVDALARAGYTKLTCREYTELKAVGVDASYVENLARHGFSHLPVHKLLEYKSMGIEPQ